jgi:integrase
VRFEPATLAKLRRDLLRRGATLATLLAEVLAGKRPPRLAELLAQRPGMRPEEALALEWRDVDKTNGVLHGHGLSL